MLSFLGDFNVLHNSSQAAYRPSKFVKIYLKKAVLATLARQAGLCDCGTALILVQSARQRLKCQRQTHTTNFLHFTSVEQTCACVILSDATAGPTYVARGGWGQRGPWGGLVEVWYLLYNTLTQYGGYRPLN